MGVAWPAAAVVAARTARTARQINKQRTMLLDKYRVYRISRLSYIESYIKTCKRIKLRATQEWRPMLTLAPRARCVCLLFNIENNNIKDSQIAQGRTAYGFLRAPLK